MRKTLLAILFLLILIAAGTYAHLTIYLPQKRLLEQRIAPLVDAFIEEGYPKQIAREKALAFDSSHLNWTANNQYNQSVIEYAVLLDRFPQLLVVEDGGMDENEWGLVDYLTSLKHQQLIPSDIMDLVPQNYTREVFSSLGNRTLSYVLSDGVVSGAEANALSYLQNFKAYPTQRRLIEFGLDNSTIAWIDLLSSLDNQTFASYALRSRLCIGDKELTPLEIKFLKNPENHSLQLIEEYLDKLDEKYPKLADELKKLPEHQSSNKVKVVEALEDIVTLALQGEPYENPEDRFDPQKITRAREVWEAFDLMLKGGTPDQRDFTYPVPSHNTELQCLYWLAEQNEFKEKDTLAQAIAMTHGLFVTMGTEEVRRAVYKDINEFLEFGRSTSELQKALGLPYNLENYPLEAKVCWAWRGNEIMKWNPLKWQPTMPTSLVYYSSNPLPLVIYEKDTVSITALRKMREFISEYSENLSSAQNNRAMLIGEHLCAEGEDKVTLRTVIRKLEAAEEEVLKKIKGSLIPEGRLHITFPNALSLHRRLGTLIGIIKTPWSFSERDVALGHFKIYDRFQLFSLLKDSGYKIINWEGIILKPFPNSKMMEFYKENPKFIEALFKIGKELPDYCAEIYICAIPKEEEK